MPDPATLATVERVTRLETIVGDLAEQLKSFVDKSGRDKAELFDRLDTLKNDFSTSRRTNWPLLISVISLGLFFSTIMAGLILFSTRATVVPLEIQLSALSREVDRHVSGQPNYDVAIGVLSERIHAIERINGLQERN